MGRGPGLLPEPGPGERGALRTCSCQEKKNGWRDGWVMDGGWMEGWMEDG